MKRVQCCAKLRKDFGHAVQGMLPRGNLRATAEIVDRDIRSTAKSDTTSTLRRRWSRPVVLPHAKRNLNMMDHTERIVQII